MANPIIICETRFKDGALTATDTAAGYDVMNVIDYRTYTFWKAASAGTKYITVDCGSDKSADSLGIIGHNLKTANATVSIESSPDNAVWTERLAGFTPTSDKAFVKLFTQATARYWRLKLIAASTAPYLAAVLLGNKLQFPFPPDTPYVPYKESVEAESKRSKKGHLLGSVVEFKTIEITARFSHIERTWVENSFKSFWDGHASDMKPFFYAWDLDAYPDMVFFVKCKDEARYEMPVSVLQYVDVIEIEMEGVKE